MIDELAYELLYWFTMWLESGPGMVTVDGRRVNDIVDLFETLNDF